MKAYWLDFENGDLAVLLQENEDKTLLEPLYLWNTNHVTLVDILLDATTIATKREKKLIRVNLSPVVEMAYTLERGGPPTRLNHFLMSLDCVKSQGYPNP